MEKRCFVTTSWDDGDQLDLKLVELLQSRGIAATFYIPIQQFRKQALSPGELRGLAQQGFEIGAHSVSHKLLRGLSNAELAAEIAPCKPALEDIVGKRVQMFCYPRGRYDANTIRVVKEAGYSGARTVRMLATKPGFDAFQMPTTVQSFPHARSVYLKNVVKARNLEGLRNLLAQRPGLGDWLELSKRMFDSVLEHGGIWHMYGHSWEIEQLDLWDDLLRLFDYVGKRNGVAYVTNGELVPQGAVVRGNRLYQGIVRGDS